jgi:hypothetical protein
MARCKAAGVRGAEKETAAESKQLGWVWPATSKRQWVREDRRKRQPLVLSGWVWPAEN